MLLEEESVVDRLEAVLGGFFRLLIEEFWPLEMLEPRKLTIRLAVVRRGELLFNFCRERICLQSTILRKVRLK